MIASLPMYDLPELRAATDAFWRGLRDHMRGAGLAEVPDALSRGEDYRQDWLRGDLFFSQTCGFPLTHALKGRVSLLATPRYRARGCEDARYRSFIVARAADAGKSLASFRGRRAAVNGLDSQSGYNVFAYELARAGLAWNDFREVEITGAHRRSLTFLRQGKADLCVVDCVVWALIGDVAPVELDGLVVLAETDWAPSLPFITAGTAAPARLEAMRTALSSAMADPALVPVRRQLRLDGVVFQPEAIYERILEQERASLLPATAETVGHARH